MHSAWMEKRLGELFDMRTGDFHAEADLEPGAIPLVSAADSNNGILGFFAIPRSKTYANALTVAYAGQPLVAKFHPYRFGAKDDVAILVPRAHLRETTLLFVAAALNRMRWRYSYGRKCYRGKLRRLLVRLPSTGTIPGGIAEEAIAGIYPKDYRALIPEKGPSLTTRDIPRLRWTRRRLTELFQLKRGDFHAIDALDPGPYATVSRVSADNGVVGYFAPPDGAALYPPGALTVSTVGGDTFVQLNEFIATDNVVVCTPKDPLEPTTLFFIAYMLNRQKWRYSYGRQCYKRKLEHVCVDVPVTADGQIDQRSMRQIVMRASYWACIAARLTGQPTRALRQPRKPAGSATRTSRKQSLSRRVRPAQDLCTERCPTTRASAARGRR
jgi:hypothetical protein